MKKRSKPIRVLFVCTGNAARSQMAEGLANHLGKGRIQANSAGTFPAGFVVGHAVAVMEEHGIDILAVMEEHGIDISRQYSKGIDDVPGAFDCVVTLCDSAVQECPVPLLQGHHEHWSTYDPSFAEGGPDAVREAFRQVRDRLETQISALIDGLLQEERPA